MKKNTTILQRTLFVIFVIAIASMMIGAKKIPKTPFSNLAKNPDYDSVVKKYGENYTERTGTSDTYAKTLTYDNYEWKGYDGTLEIVFSLVYVKDKHNNEVQALRVKEAEWKMEMSSEDEEEVKAFEETVREYFNTKIGNYKRNGFYPDGPGSWYDELGNRYSLWQVTQYGKSSVTITFH